MSQHGNGNANIHANGNLTNDVTNGSGNVNINGKLDQNGANAKKLLIQNKRLQVASKLGDNLCPSPMITAAGDIEHAVAPNVDGLLNSRKISVQGAEMGKAKANKLRAWVVENFFIWSGDTVQDFESCLFLVGNLISSSQITDD